MYYLINDQILAAEKATVPITDLALLRGYGIFDFFRLEGDRPLFLDNHLNRFFNSAKILRLPCPLDRTMLKAKITEMLALNDIRDSGVRVVLTGGPSPNGYAIGSPTLIVINEPITPLPVEHFTKGVKLITHEYMRDLPEVKTTNYLMGIYKMPEIKEAGAMDVLYHWQGKISELTRSNFFIVNREGTLVTPEMGILRGITRSKVLELAPAHFKVETRPVHLDEVYAASEAFITGTTKKVMPVVQVDDHIIGDGIPGNTTVKLQELFEQHVKTYVEGGI